MEKIEWTEDLSVNIPKLDEQHKTLLGIINQLREAVAQGKGFAITSRLLDYLTEYILTHFELEELYFKKYSYPGRHEHIKRHQDFASKITRFILDNDKNRDLVSENLLEFLTDWFINHVKKEDKDFGLFYSKANAS